MKNVKNKIVWEHNTILLKIVYKKFVNPEKRLYLCNRYPENNLFALRRLIPIEDLKRSPVKVVAFFYLQKFSKFHKKRCDMENNTATLIRQLAARDETVEFLAADPSSFMHQVTGDTNRETTAFVASALSYGARKQFFPKIQRIIDWAGGDVDLWVRSGRFVDDIPDDDGCYYRLYTNRTMRAFLVALQRLLVDYGSLRGFAEAVLAAESMKQGAKSMEREVESMEQEADGCRDAFVVIGGLCRFFADNGSVGVVPKNTTSACKRVCMFLRWMVRDASPVDLGLWADIIDRRTLVMPMDTHVVSEAFRLGLLSSKGASMTSARRLTARMSDIFPDDPLKGDFALFGLGVDEQAR